MSFLSLWRRCKTKDWVPKYLYVRSVTLDGYRPSHHLEARLSRLEVIVGANGSGKSSLFEFLKFLRDSVKYQGPTIPGYG